MQSFRRFLRFAGTFILILGLALSFLWVSGGSQALAALALQAFHW